MSLVAAYSDSDSGSDTEEKTTSAKSNVVPDKEADVNKSTNVERRCEEISKHLVGSSVDDIVDEEEIVNNVKEKTALFSVLPQPKSKFSAIEEDIDDEFMKKKVYSSEEIKPPKKSLKKGNKKQPVKILIPTLDELGNDSDSETDENPKDKEKATLKKKTTLFSMLPKPKHSVTVGMNRNKIFAPEANRPLIPHTLTKKKETKVESKEIKQKSNETRRNKSSLVGEISDSDEDDSTDSNNFFSLSDDKVKNDNVSKLKTITETSVNSFVDEESKNIKKTLVVDDKRSLNESKKNTNIELEKQPSSVVEENKKGNAFFASLFKTSNTSATGNKPDNKPNKKAIIGESSNSDAKNTLAPTSKRPKISANPDVTVPYSDVTAPYGDVTAPYGDVTAPYGEVTAPYGNVTAPYGKAKDVTAPYDTSSFAAHTGSVIDTASTQKPGKSYPTSNFFAYAYHKDDATDHAIEAQGTAEIDHYNRPNEDLPIDQDALRALQGKKRRKEEINLIDVRADDIQANRQDYLKNLTAESAEQHKLMVAHKEKDQPTSSQKRKHQITYLAHQAKERELLLQQAWAESAATKRQTQSKYGF